MVEFVYLEGEITCILTTMANRARFGFGNCFEVGHGSHSRLIGANSKNGGERDVWLMEAMKKEVPNNKGREMR